MGPWSLQIDDTRLTLCDMFTAETFEISVANIDAGLLTSIRVSFFDFMCSSYLGTSLCRCWVPKLALRPSQTLMFTKKETSINTSV